MRGKKSEVVNQLLEEKQYDKIDDSFNYLTKLPLDSVIKENIEKILKDYELKDICVKELKNKKIEDIWLDELNILKSVYKNYKITRSNLQNNDNIN